jgi:multiple sugar transport system ATP-binding protein
MVFQNHALYPHLTVAENLAFGLKLRKRPPAEIAQRVRETAAMLGLTACLDRKPAALSGGERQRVALGRALVRQPQVLLCDEPLSNLDAPMRGQMRAELLRLHRRLGATIIYVTHDQQEATALGRRIAVLKTGVIQQVAAPLTLYDQPANLFVAGFIGSPPMNFVRGVLLARDGAVWFQGEDLAEAGRNLSLRLPAEQSEKLAAALGRRVVLGLRPEHVLCESAAGGAAEAIPATVEMVELMGAESHLHLRTGPWSFVARTSADLPWRVNEEVRLSFDMRRAHFFDAVTGEALGPGAAPLQRPSFRTPDPVETSRTHLATTGQNFVAYATRFCTTAWRAGLGVFHRRRRPKARDREV